MCELNEKNISKQNQLRDDKYDERYFFVKNLLAWAIFVLNTYDARELSAHMCPSAFTLGRMCADKSPDASNDLRPSVKAPLHNV